VQAFSSSYVLYTRLTTVTRQTGEYKVDFTRHPKFPLAVGEQSFPTMEHKIKYINPEINEK
jgi:hypothetical protein